MNRLATALLIAIWAATALAEDWPGFRGPTRQGISTETGLPLHWSTTDNIAWKTEIPGLGWSSPIVHGDRVFVTTATDNGVSCRVLCLDRNTGKIAWDKEVFQQPTKRKEAKNSYATPTPVTDGQRVYAAFADGSLVALDYQGSVLWTNRDIRFYSQHGLGVSPILHQDLLIMPFDGSSEGDDRYLGWRKPWDKAVILALDKNTGKPRWKAGRGLSRIAHVTPGILDLDGRTQLISAAGDAVQGHDARTGQMIWTIYSQGEGVVPSVVIADGLVFTASGFEQPTIRAVRLGGQGDVTKTHIAWEQKAHVPAMSSFLYANKLLFSIKETGMALCMKPDTGQILWQQRIPGNHCASPIYADGSIFFLSEEGESAIIEAGPQFKLITSNRIDEKCQASYAVSHNQLFIRSEKHLFCIGQKPKP